LASVQAQAYPASEVIVVDGASTDDSAAFATATGIPDRVLTVEHRNAAAARNTRVVEAYCGWLAFLGAGNCWERNHRAPARYLLEQGGDGVFCAPPLAVDQHAGDGIAVKRAGQAVAIAYQYGGHEAAMRALRTGHHHLVIFQRVRLF